MLRVYVNIEARIDFATIHCSKMTHHSAQLRVRARADVRTEGKASAMEEAIIVSNCVASLRATSKINVE